MSLWFNGDPANTPQRMYVALSGTNGATGVVAHDDTNAAQIDRWTQWSIPLTEFSNQGVVLTRVQSVSIGFGDKNNPQPDGAGNVYFDDLRLERP
ncbi:MAG: hypothetical protein A2Z25_14050 [Planctomycetes bacterium RBG_16_55_9]|nr:MAG: hypothetical protein A2Z25_14050 [Planctomycetes bacterium RBG_16_55_9]